MTRHNNIFILTGMHRSGTSLMAKILANSGVDMGQNLLDAASGNPYGYFEDVEIINFHMRILKRVCRWSDPYCMWPFNEPEVSVQDRETALKLIINKANGDRPWGWKEPRTCLFLEFWKEVLPQARFFFVFRHPGLVVDSQAMRERKARWNRFANNRFMNGWILYNNKLVEFYLKHRDQCVLFSLERAIERMDDFIGLIKSRFGFELSREGFLKSFDRGILHCHPQKERSISPTIKTTAEKLYQRLLDLSEI